MSSRDNAVADYCFTHFGHNFKMLEYNAKDVYLFSDNAPFQQLMVPRTVEHIHEDKPGVIVHISSIEIPKNLTATDFLPPPNAINLNEQAASIPLDAKTALGESQRPDEVRIPAAAISSNFISGKQPKYPGLAKAAHISGTVVLTATITKDGTVTNLTALSGEPILVDAAIKAVKTWRYRPYLFNGEPADVDTTINVKFSMGK